MTTQDAAPPVSAHTVWEVASRSNLAEVSALLAQFPPSKRQQDPLATALRAVESVLNADVKGGIALLRRALEQSSGMTRQYLTDVLASYLVSVDDLDGTERYLDDTPAGPELLPSYLSARAIVAARRGNDDASREHGRRALAELASSTDAIIFARTVLRVGLAAFYRGDYDEAQEHSLEGARACERLAAYRLAASGYLILYIIAGDWLGDLDLKRMYAERIAAVAQLAGDQSVQNLGLVAQLEIAAESGDHLRFTSIHRRLLDNPLHTQYRERFAFVLAGAIANGWLGRFQAARAALEATRKRADRSVPEALLCDAIAALIETARWNVDEARELAHAVLAGTAERAAREPLYDAHRRRTARILAACACIIIGEETRGRRALSRTFDPDGQFAKIDRRKGLDENDVPPLFRGYARLINVVCKAAAEARPQLDLTRAEMALLKSLPSGVTVGEIASDFGKSKKTVEKQLGSIYSKMDVSNRAQAIEKARALGIMA